MPVITIQLPGSPGSPGPKGDPGSSNVLTIGTVTTSAPGSAGGATISGVSPAQVLNLTIPQGPKGDKGDPGTSPTLASGTINTGAAGTNVIATVTGSFPNYLLNLTIPRGNTGLTGATGPAPNLTIGTVTSGTAAATITGSNPNYSLNLTLPPGPKGDTGATGPQGPPGIPGTADGDGTGVPLGGLTDYVLAKLGPEDFNHGWVKGSNTADANSFMKRDANGRAIITAPTAGNQIANKDYVDTGDAAQATALTTHGALTAAHGAAGAVVGTTNTQTISNKTLVVPKITTGIDITANDTPGNPAAGDYRLAIASTTGAMTFRGSTGVIRTIPQFHGTGNTFPSYAQEGDTYFHTIFGCMCVYVTGNVWRQVNMAFLTSGSDPAAEMATYSASLTAAGLNPHNGFQVMHTPSDTIYYFLGSSASNYRVQTHLPDSDWITPTLLNGWARYSTSWPTAQYRKLNNGMVVIRGLVNSGAINDPVFNLPVGYRPSIQQLFATGSNAQWARIDVQANGNVFPSQAPGYTVTTTWVSLQLTFFADA